MLLIKRVFQTHLVFFQQQLGHISICLWLRFKVTDDCVQLNGDNEDRAD